MKFIIPQAYNRFINILVKSLHVIVLNKITIEGIMNSYLGLIKVIFSLKNFENPYFYIFLFITICISLHMSLSPADIKGAFGGLLFIFIILFILNALNLSKYITTVDLIRYNVFIIGILIIAVFLSAITFLISSILLIIKEK